MHALTIAFEGKDSITHTWTLCDKGAKKDDVVVKLAHETVAGFMDAGTMRANGKKSF